MSSSPFSNLQHNENKNIRFHEILFFLKKFQMLFLLLNAFPLMNCDRNKWVRVLNLVTMEDMEELPILTILFLWRSVSFHLLESTREHSLMTYQFDAPYANWRQPRSRLHSRWEDSA